MSTFADGYSRYLTHYFNYAHKYKTLRDMFRSSYLFVSDPLFLNKKLIDHLGDFPKYPYFMNIISGTDSINIVNIYNSTLDSTDQLLGSIVGSPQVSNKLNYDKIPQNIQDIVRESCFQYSYISSKDDIYEYNSIVRSFLIETAYRNFFSDLYSPFFYSSDQIAGQTAGLENKSFIIDYMLYCLLYITLSKSHNFHTSLSSYLIYVNSGGTIPSEIVDVNAITTSFSSFVSNKSSEISYYLSDLMGKSIYGFTQLSDSLHISLMSVISGELTNLSTIFSTFLNSMGSLDPSPLMIANSINNLDGLVSADCVSKLYNNSSIIDSTFTNSETTFEENQYNIYMGNIASSTVQNYLFLCYLYKFWPMKFLNIMQLSLKQYTEDVIKSPDNNIQTATDYSSTLRIFIQNYVNYTNLESFLTTWFTTSYLDTLSYTFQVDKFGCLMYYIQTLDIFFSSTAFSSFVSNLAEAVFIYLRDNGHVNYNVDWYTYHEVINIYLKVYFRWKLFDKSSSILTNLTQSRFKFANNINAVYCLDSDSYNSVNVDDYIFASTDTIDNAQQVVSKTISGNDYVLNLASNYTGRTTPTSSVNGYSYNSLSTTLFEDVTNKFSNLYYRVISNFTGISDYDVSVDIPSPSELLVIFNSILSSSITPQNMHQFNENLMTSVLTREVIYSVLSDFVT